LALTVAEKVEKVEKANVTHEVTHGSGPRNEVPNTLVAVATLEA
jgi:hypothetical protein